MNKQHILYIASSLVLAGALASCRPTVPTPKPTGYFKLEMPERGYQRFDSATFPFSFEYPIYGSISQDTALAKREHSPYWINVDFWQLNATIFLSYKTIGPGAHIDQLINESYTLSQKHDIKADYIRNSDEFTTAQGLRAMYYSVGGNAASSYQFYITDHKKNFLRGSLYFNVTPNVDSLRPALDFLRTDLEKLVETFEFK